MVHHYPPRIQIAGRAKKKGVDSPILFARDKILGSMFRPGPGLAPGNSSFFEFLDDSISNDLIDLVHALNKVVD